MRAIYLLQYNNNANVRILGYRSVVMLTCDVEVRAPFTFKHTLQCISGIRVSEKHLSEGSWYLGSKTFSNRVKPMYNVVGLLNGAAY